MTSVPKNVDFTDITKKKLQILSVVLTCEHYTVCNKILKMYIIKEMSSIIGITNPLWQ